MDVILDREELYREVWSATVSAVARKYDLTDYDIRKACFALDVPTPIQGYWAKVKAGNPPPVPPLPKKRGASTFTCERKPPLPVGAVVARKARSPSANARPDKTKSKPEELVDWVLRNSAELAAEKAENPPPSRQPRPRHRLSPADAAKQPRYVPLEIWGKLLFGEYAPHINTLRRWVHDGHIQPQPKKMGKYWFVKVDAEYVA